MPSPKHIPVNEDTHKAVTVLKAEEHHRTVDQTIMFLVRFYRSMKRKDKALTDKIKFNLN